MCSGETVRALSGGDFVDHLEAKRPLVQPPDLLHGPAELAREARRDRVSGEPATAAGPEEETCPRGLPGCPRGARTSTGLPARHPAADPPPPHAARPAPARPGARGATSSSADPRRAPAVTMRDAPRRGRNTSPPARGARQRDELAQGAGEPGLRRRRAAERGEQIGEEAADLHRDPTLLHRGRTRTVQHLPARDLEVKHAASL